MTDEQQRVAQAYAAMTSEDFATIFADLKDFVRAMPGSELAQAGGWQVLGHLIHRRDALRREKVRGVAKPAKGRLTNG